MATIGIAGVNYEVYGALAAANAYFAAASQGAPWLAAESSLRNQALVTATRVFERTGWSGNPTDTVVPVPPATLPLSAGEQALQWPRTGLVDRNGVALDSTSIPTDVINGNFEYALDLINTPSVQTDDVRGSNVKSTKSLERVEGAVTVSSEQVNFIPTIGRFAQFPKIVQDYIGLWLDSSGSLTLSFVSGTDAEALELDFGFAGPQGLP